MLEIPIYQVDAFAQNVFEGNPAAICILNESISHEMMQSIASENNLAETAFVVPRAEFYEIRWFTPTVEVDLCGHATLAAAYVIYELYDHALDHIAFYSPKSGELGVNKKDNLLYLDFPIDTINIAHHSEFAAVEAALGLRIDSLYRGKTDLLALIESESTLKEMNVNLLKISQLEARGLIVTAKGNGVDFVSRFFAPQSGINEDPVTGSAHTSLIPFWAERLQKDRMIAWQLSERAGYLQCELSGSRCHIGGSCQLYLKGTIYL